MASRLKPLVIVFHDPTRSVPFNPFPSLFHSVDWHRGEQDPFERLFSFDRLLFPDTHHPSGHWLPCHRGSFLWRLNTDCLPCDGKDRCSGWAIFCCRQVHRLFLGLRVFTASVLSPSHPLPFPSAPH